MDEIKSTKVKGRFKILKVTSYKDCPVYIRQVDEDIFEYMLIFKNKLYSHYIVVSPEQGKKKLTKKQMMSAASVIFTGAVTTIDELIKMNTPITTTAN